MKILSGVYVFDTWLYRVKKAIKSLDIEVVLQYHDEILLLLDEKHKAQLDAILKEAMVQTNRDLALNIEIGISVDFGQNYGECH